MPEICEEVTAVSMLKDTNQAHALAGDFVLTYLRGQLRQLLGGAKQLRRLLPLRLLDLLVVEEPHRRAPPYDPVPVVLNPRTTTSARDMTRVTLSRRYKLHKGSGTHLLLRDGVVYQHQVRQPRELAQHVQVRQLGQAIRGEHQVCQVGDGVRQGGLDGRDAVARQQERMYPRRQREVAEDLDVIVGKVYGVLWLNGTTQLVMPHPCVRGLEEDGEMGRGRKMVRGGGRTYACDTKVLYGGYSVSYSPTKTGSISTLALS